MGQSIFSTEVMVSIMPPIVAAKELTAEGDWRAAVVLLNRHDYNDKEISKIIAISSRHIMRYRKDNNIAPVDPDTYMTSWAERFIPNPELETA